jgi:hypothetical protein
MQRQTSLAAKELPQQAAGRGWQRLVEANLAELVPTDTRPGQKPCEFLAVVGDGGPLGFIGLGRLGRGWLVAHRQT